MAVGVWMLAGQASAHVEASPASVAAGSTDTITFNVEHGCGDSATVKLEMKLADGVTDANARGDHGLDLFGGGRRDHVDRWSAASRPAAGRARRDDVPRHAWCDAALPTRADVRAGRDALGRSAEPRRQRGRRPGAACRADGLHGWWRVDLGVAGDNGRRGDNRGSLDNRSSGHDRSGTCLDRSRDHRRDERRQLRQHRRDRCRRSRSPPSLVLGVGAFLLVRSKRP